jgi:hypothetical protein
VSELIINHQRLGEKHMADPDMAKFNKALEKLCVDCASEVNKILANCRSSVVSRLEKMASDMKKLDVPTASPDDLDEVSAQVSAILKKESARFEKILTLTAAVRFDASGKLTVPAVGVSGPMATV